MKATIYTDSEFMGNIIKYEARELLEHGTKRYAQYGNSPFVTWIPEGKRKPVGIVKSYQPTVLILEGVGHPEPDKMFADAPFTGNVLVQEAKYASFDEGWEKDFDAMVDKYIAENNVKVIADYRHTKGFSSY